MEQSQVTLTTSQKIVSNSELINFLEWEDVNIATDELYEYYKTYARNIKNPEIIRDYCKQMIEWSMFGKQGLYIVGDVGCGKTTLLNAFCKDITMHFYTNDSRTRGGFQWESANTL